ncbi:MAG: hypothetical protein LIO57_09045 [Oscillospiraceae bacterium]|nr:hypothetical protein [Oscillospiraceae bacterium]
MDKELENALRNLVRLGTVSAVDAANRRAKVIYEDRDGLVSGWLPILQHSGAGVSVASDGAHSHTAPMGTTSTDGAHDHTGTALGTWLPNVNDKVVTLYLPVFNADGFILGAI